MKNKQNGITLIALVITIIVLLILAGVSISLVVGENGVLNKASTAKTETIVAQESETVKLAAAAAKVDTLGGEILEENLARELTNTIGTRGTDYELVKEGDVFKVTYLENGEEGNSYYVNADGAILKKGAWVETNANGTLGVSNGVQNIQIGDYVYYDHVTGAKELSYVSPSDKNGRKDQTFVLAEFNEDGSINEDAVTSYPVDGKWQVLGINSQGQILITTEGRVGAIDNNNRYTIYGYDGYVNANQELENISKLYGQGYGAVDARSITENDVNKITGFIPSSYNTGEINAYENEVTFYWNGTNYPYYVGKNGVTGSLSQGHNKSSGNYGFNWYENGWQFSACPEMTETTEVSEMQKIATIKSDAYYYEVEDYLTYDSKVYNTLFSTKGYFLRSAVDVNTTRIDYSMLGVRCGCGGADNIGTDMIKTADGNGNNSTSEVRPVVVLDANIKLTGSSAEGWTIVK